MKKFLAAGIQMDIKPGDVEFNLKTAIGISEKALKFDPNLIVFPKCSPQGSLSPT